MDSVAGTMNGSGSTGSRRAAISSLLVLMLGLGWSLLVMRGCEKTSMDVSKPVEVSIGGKHYTLELAASDSKRHKGMGDRTSIPDGTGMLFVFSSANKLEFVMRDCPIGIDILFLDSGGRVTAMHNMAKEEPRRANETEMQYETRLKRYSSRTAAQFAIEIADGALKSLNVKNGDKIDIEAEALVKLCREAEAAELKANAGPGLKKPTK